MEISAFPFLNNTGESYYLSTNIFGSTQDFNTMTNFKRHKTDTGHIFSYDQGNETLEDTSFSFQDILSNLEIFPPILNNQQQVISKPITPDQQLYRTETTTTTDHRSQVMNDNKTNTNPNDHKRCQPDTGSAMPAAQDEAGSSNLHTQRRLWVKSRSKAWWEQCDSAEFSDEEFKKYFRMRKATFDMICRELDPVVNKKDTMLRLAIPVRHRVAVCIYRLATGEPLREVSKKFGLGISTCHKIVLEVCKAIQDVLKPKTLNWPDEVRLNEIKTGFEMISGIPNVGGSLYTSHVPIIAPKDKVAAYFNKKHTERNQKTSYTISVQGVVDCSGIFTDVSIGWPGSMPDDKVLEKSSLFQRANMGLMKDVTVVGNSGHPLMDWVMTPYNQQHLTWTQHAFNEKVAEVQNIAKEAFMRLKARWSCLQKRTEMKLQDLPLVLMACCVLHNICEMNNEGLSNDLRFELFDDQMIADTGVRSVSASQYRDQIAHKLLHHNHAGTSFLL